MIGPPSKPQYLGVLLAFQGFNRTCVNEISSTFTTTKLSPSLPRKLRQITMAPKAEKKPAKKVAKTAKTGAKKKSKAKVESFKIYIYKVLKQVRRLSVSGARLHFACWNLSHFCQSRLSGNIEENSPLFRRLR